MLRRLSRGQRWRTACLLVLAYLCAVMAPAAANALALSPLLPHHAGTQVAASHHATLNGAHAHVHADGAEHVHHEDHAQAPDQSSDHAGGDIQCCGLACISALPVVLSDVAMPTMPKCVRLAANFVDVTGRMPAGLYRPPIS